MQSEQNKAIALQMYETFDRLNLEQSIEFLAPNFVAYVPGAPGTLDRDAFIKTVLTPFRAAFPDGRHTIEDIISEADKVVTRGSFSGTHQGELFGIPATNKQITIAIVHIDRIADGKIVEHWGQSDVLGMMQQLGVFPPPGIVGFLGRLLFAIGLIIPKRKNPA